MPDETDAFGRPLRPEGSDPFGAPTDPEGPSGGPPGWAPPRPAEESPSDTVAMRWEPPVSPGDATTGELSGWWRRVGATVLDGLIVGILGAILGGILASAGATENETTAIGALFGIVMGVVYYGTLMSRKGANNGQTWGKQALGIRVVRIDGQQVTFGFALLREVLIKTVLFGYVAILTLYLATLLNYLWPLWDAQNRALHDRIAKTLVKRA